jgi:hypothetical protein
MMETPTTDQVLQPGQVPTHLNRIGRCKPCKKRFTWPINKLPLRSLGCPDCGTPLSLTTTLGDTPFHVIQCPPVIH